MSVRKCMLCSTLYEFRGIPYCPDCSIEVDKAFTKIRDYVYEHPNASTREIIEETEVKDTVVNYLIKEGRLKAIARNAFSGCQRCGKPANGAYCPECEKRLAGALGITPSVAPRDIIPRSGAGSVMHTYSSSDHKK